MKTLRLASVILLLTAFNAFAQIAAPPAPVETPAVQTQSKTSPLPRDIHWFRDSAEYRACAIQAYRGAARQLDSISGELTSGTWAVVLDADETILDNSQYQRELAERNTSHSSTLWKAWCNRVEATAIPGAKEFLGHVRQLGGKIAVVTNRSTDEQPATEKNFKKLGMPYDLMLCRSGRGDKEERSKAIEEGTAALGVSPLKIKMWVGDNIQDFPGMRQDVREKDESAFAEFGRKYVIIPNPMYGSWERNAER